MPMTRHELSRAPTTAPFKGPAKYGAGGETPAAATSRNGLPRRHSVAPGCRGRSVHWGCLPKVHSSPRGDAGNRDTQNAARQPQHGGGTPSMASRGCTASSASLTRSSHGWHRGHTMAFSLRAGEMEHKLCGGQAPDHWTRTSGSIREGASYHGHPCNRFLHLRWVSQNFAEESCALSMSEAQPLHRPQTLASGLGEEPLNPLLQA